MNYRKILFILSAAILIPSFSLAAPADQASRITSLQTRADAEISRRITALNTAQAKVSNLKRLTAGEQATFSAEISQNIGDLTTLKTKIDADTDPTVLKTDVQSIVDSYRIFAVFIPQIHILAAVDALTTTTTSLTSLSGKLQQRITLDAQAGDNVSALTTSLADMDSKIADANSLATTIAGETASLTPAGYPGNASTIQAALTSLKSARADVAAAQADAKTVIAGLKTLESTTSS